MMEVDRLLQYVYLTDLNSPWFGLHFDLQEVLAQLDQYIYCSQWHLTFLDTGESLTSWPTENL